MFRSSMRSSSGSFFIYLLVDVADIKKLLKYLKIIINPSWLCGSICL